MALRETFFSTTGFGKSPKLGLQLFDALKAWDFAKVEALLEAGAYPNVKEPLLGQTPLFEAARHGHKDIVTSLLKHGAKVNVVDKMGRTPLLSASYLGDPETYNTLVEHGADPLAGDPKTRASLLLHALTRGHEKTADILLKAGAASTQPEEGKDTLDRLLQITASWGQPGTLRLLLAAGAKAGARDEMSCSVLELAVKGGNADCIAQIAALCPEDLKRLTANNRTLLRLAFDEQKPDSVRGLLAAGADKNEKDQYLSTPLHYAADLGCTEGLQTLLDAGADFRALDQYDRSPLWHAVVQRHPDCVKALLAAGADPNEKYSDRESLLSNAACFGDTQIVKALIDAGADIHKPDKDGSSILRTALKFSNGKADTVKVILDAGADTRHSSEGDKRGEDVTDEQYGRDRGMYVSGAVIAAAWKFKMLDAAEENDARRVKELLETGAPPDTMGSDGHTALMLAAKHGYADVVKVLLEQKAAPLIRHKGGECPTLFKAILSGSAYTVRLLLAAGTPAELPGLAGETPLCVACGSGDVLVAKELLKAGASPTLPDSCGQTPIFAAISSGCAETVEAIAAAGAKVNVKDPKGYSALERAESSNNAALVKVIQNYRSREIEEMAEDATRLSKKMTPLKTLRFKSGMN